VGNIEGLTAREVVLALLDAAPDRTLHGRTVMQKLCYFAGVAIGEDLGHGAYYYGPFSREVDDGLEIAALAGQVKEITVRMAAGGRDVRQYNYTLTDEGRDTLAALRPMHQEQVDAVQRVLQEVQATVPGLNQRSLSQAAKIHLILTQQGAPVDAGELPAMASQLGWELTRDDVTSTIELLDKLNLVEVT
jgi:uncharacterized protein YwgA